MPTRPAPPAVRLPHCGDPACDRDTRLVETGDGQVRRCPACHPLSPTSLPSLHARRVELERELAQLELLISEAETAAAPEWVRGPVPPPHLDPEP